MRRGDSGKASLPLGLHRLQSRHGQAKKKALNHQGQRKRLQNAESTASYRFIGSRWARASNLSLSSVMGYFEILHDS